MALFKIIITGGNISMRILSMIRKTIFIIEIRSCVPSTVVKVRSQLPVLGRGYLTMPWEILKAGKIVNIVQAYLEIELKECCAIY